MNQLVETVEYLEGRRIGFRSLSGAIDTTTGGGKLVFHIFGALAEFERGIIRERIRAGLDATATRGRKGGPPQKLSAEGLKAAKALLTYPTITVDAVARRLDVSPATLYGHLPAARSLAQVTG